MKRIIALLTALSFVGCSAPMISTVPPDLEIGRLGHRTAFELGGEAPPAPAPGPAPAETDTTTPPATDDTAGPDAAPSDDEPSSAPAASEQVGRAAMQPDAPLQDPGEPDKRQRTRTALFWAGIALVAIGSASAIAFAVGGQATEDKLSRGYRDGITREEEKTLINRGELMNGLAAAGGGIAIIGLAFATIAYGVDYTRCGSLAKRRKKPCTDKQRARR